jgi:N-acetylglucosamine-6-phosphate deacetylase
MHTAQRTLSVPDGWVDVQVNGYVGVDFSTAGLTVDDVRRATEELVRRGTAAYCPTVITCAPEVYEQNLQVLAAAMREPDLRPHLLGIHLEGPFLANDAKGAHQTRWLQRPDIALFDRWMKLAEGRIRLLTLAPELEGADALIRHATGCGVTVLIGHHVGDNASIDRAARAGARGCTHLGNGIPNVLPRHPNPIWTQLADDRLVGLFIADGYHLPAEFVKVALRAKGLER